MELRNEKVKDIVRSFFYGNGQYRTWIEELLTGKDTNDFIALNNLLGKWKPEEEEYIELDEDLTISSKELKDIANDLNRYLANEYIETLQG